MVEATEKKCEMCGRRIVPRQDEWALDKNGDALCRPCHIQAVLLLKAEGIDWEGQTFGYELGEAETFGGPTDELSDAYFILDVNKTDTLKRAVSLIRTSVNCSRAMARSVKVLKPRLSEIPPSAT